MRKSIYAVVLILGLSILGSCKIEPEPAPAPIPTPIPGPVPEPQPEPQPEPVKVTSISLNTDSASLTEGETLELVVTVSPSNADNKKVVWTTSNASVATVNEGTVTAVREGEAVITATSDDGGKTASCNVTVINKTVNPGGSEDIAIEEW